MNSDEERELIAKHKIKFLGPLPDSRWPAHYVPLFEPLREIEKVKYDEYVREAKRRKGIPEGRQMRETIRNTQRLQNTANYCRKTGAQEQDWRANTENYVFRRFKEDVTW